jgi:hypothetical protein
MQTISAKSRIEGQRQLFTGYRLILSSGWLSSVVVGLWLDPKTSLFIKATNLILNMCNFDKNKHNNRLVDKDFELQESKKNFKINACDFSTHLTLF